MVRNLSERSLFMGRGSVVNSGGGGGGAKKFGCLFMRGGAKNAFKLSI